jgi:hypothetical protein
MGLTLKFATGAREPIVAAVAKFDFDYLEMLESEKKIADFSLHLEPNDLNFLVNCATELVEIDEFGLRECLDTTEFYFDSEEGGAYYVDPAITDLFSMFNENEAEVLTIKWFKSMSAYHGEPVEVNDDAVEAVRRLIAISKEAIVENLDLVHFWFP